MSSKLKINDTVLLLDHPNKNDIDHAAIVREIHANGDITVTNTNMPFNGTYSWSNGLIKKGRYKKSND